VLLLFLLFSFGATIQHESPSHIFRFAVQVLDREGKFLARSKRVLTTDCCCCIGCSDRSWGIFLHGLAYDRLLTLCDHSMSVWSISAKMENNVRFLIRCSELDEALYCVQLGEKLVQLWFLCDHKSVVDISFPQTRGSAKVSKTLVSTFSVIRFATTDEEHIAVPKTCLYFFSTKSKTCWTKANFESLGRLLTNLCVDSAPNRIMDVAWQYRINNSSKCSNCYGPRAFGDPTVLCVKFVLYYMQG